MEEPTFRSGWRGRPSGPDGEADLQVGPAPAVCGRAEAVATPPLAALETDPSVRSRFMRAAHRATPQETRVRWRSNRSLPAGRFRAIAHRAARVGAATASRLRLIRIAPRPMKAGCDGARTAHSFRGGFMLRTSRPSSRPAFANPEGEPAECRAYYPRLRTNQLSRIPQHNSWIQTHRAA
jgi:hypothetical protein